MYAALLRFYNYLLFHRDMQDRGLLRLDFGTLFNEWLAQQQDSGSSQVVYAAENAGELGSCRIPVGVRHALEQQVLHRSDQWKPNHTSPEPESPILRRHRINPIRKLVESDSEEGNPCSKAGGCLPRGLDAVKAGTPESKSGGKPFCSTEPSNQFLTWESILIWSDPVAWQVTADHCLWEVIMTN
jgi:hypothetical protein